MVQPKAAVLLGGGAPNGALMAGALAGIYDAGRTFNQFYTSGAGGMIGLTYVAGKGPNPNEALSQLLRAGVDDSIYQFVPFGYKTFFKSGPFTVPLKEWGERFKADESNSPYRRVYNDLIDLFITAITPTDLTPGSEALCAHYPFLHRIIDFKRLQKFNGAFHMSAYCIDTGKMEQFDKDEIGPEHFYASLSFPFIYPPTLINGKYYYEGAAYDPLNLPTCHQRCRDGGIELFVIMDVLGPYRKALVRRPRNLLDAYGISIMMPVVAMATKDLKGFLQTHGQRQQQQQQQQQQGNAGGGRPYEVKRLRFNIAKHDYPALCDWSYSNLHRQWAIGYRAGRRFAENPKYRDRLPRHAPDSADPI
jgi:predicted acylesterase/phospholipase RssA